MIYLDGWDLGMPWEGVPEESASPPSPVAQPPQALGQLPLLCSENLPRASSHIPCSTSFSTLGALKVDLAPVPCHLCSFSDRHPISAATVHANACPSHHKTAVAWKPAVELSQALWETKKKCVVDVCFVTSVYWPSFTIPRGNPISLLDKPLFAGGRKQPTPVLAGCSSSGYGKCYLAPARRMLFWWVMWGQVEQMLTAWKPYPENQATPFAVIPTVSPLEFYSISFFLSLSSSPLPILWSPISL